MTNWRSAVALGLMLVGVGAAVTSHTVVAQHTPAVSVPSQHVDVVHVPRNVWDSMREKENKLIAELKAEKARKLQGIDLKQFVTRLGKYAMDVVAHIDNPTQQSGARLRSDSVGLGWYLDSLDTGG